LENKTLSFKHSCFSGDLIYAMAGIKAMCEVEGDQAIIHQWLNQEGVAYLGANHPYDGKMMNDYAFEMLKPLLEHQPYVKEFKPWKGEKVHIDIDQFRQVKNHMPYGNIATWPAFACPEMMPRYWEPWLIAHAYERAEFIHDHPELKDSIVINRTGRYHGDWVDYFHLKEHADRLVFVGTEEERKQFFTDFDLDFKWYEARDFLDLSYLIASCKLFIGNQSMCFAIAEGLKVPRLLEVCDRCPNVQPTGPGAGYFRATVPFKYLVEKFLK
jgi:hypothetical protein